MLMSYENIWHAIDELNTNAIILIDVEGVIRKINKGVTFHLGYREHDIIGKKIEILLPDDVKELHRSRFSNYIESRREEVGYKSKLIGVQRVFPDTIVIENNEPKRFSLIQKNQQEIPINLTINEICSDSGALIGFIAIILNNTEQYNLQQNLRFQATHDQLTGLLNWEGFESEVQATKKYILQQNKVYYASLLFLSVDYFKVINFNSQKAGDYALKKIGTWLLNYTRQEENRDFDIITSRFLSDEFILYIPCMPIKSALILANRLKEKFAKLNLRTAENPFFTSVSIGVTQITRDSKLNDAISHALNACRKAKGKGKDKIEVVMEEDINYLQFDTVIRKALQNQRLKLYAQKIIAISSSAKSIDNNRAHYEVLSRLEDKQGNIISPAEFIPAAENLGLAIAIDKYVVEHTLAFLRNNSDHEKLISLCSINLSGISVSNEKMFTFIEQQIRQSGIDPSKLCFEVTETHQILDEEVANALVSNLKKLGCKFAFDDFGIGFSNYQSFSRLPVDIIKIDGSYIRKMLENRHLRADVEGMVNSAKIRGLEIVGEYAENEQIVEEMVRLGVDYAQGYYFSKPAPLEALI